MFFHIICENNDLPAILGEDLGARRAIIISVMPGDLDGTFQSVPDQSHTDLQKLQRVY